MTTTHTIRDALEADQAQMKEWFEHLHRSPELSMQEQETAKYIAEIVGQWGYDVETGIGASPSQILVAHEPQIFGDLSASVRRGTGTGAACRRRKPSCAS